MDKHLEDFVTGKINISEYMEGAQGVPNYFIPEMMVKVFNEVLSEPIEETISPQGFFLLTQCIGVIKQVIIDPKRFHNILVGMVHKEISEVIDKLSSSVTTPITEAFEIVYPIFDNLCIFLAIDTFSDLKPTILPIFCASKEEVVAKHELLNAVKTQGVKVLYTLLISSSDLIMEHIDTVPLGKQLGVVSKKFIEKEKENENKPESVDSI